MAEFARFRDYYFVAESEGQIVGYVNGSVRTNGDVRVLPQGTTYLEVENIFVMSNFRISGVGSALIEKLLTVAEANGVERFFVSTVTKDMDRILRFYRGLDFKPWYLELFR